jgi:hypothetical protein
VMVALRRYLPGELFARLYAANAVRMVTTPEPSARPAGRLEMGAK